MSAQVTIATLKEHDLTESQIREEWGRSLRTPPDIAISRACVTALEWDGTEAEGAVIQARQRICDAINARRAKAAP